MSIKYFIVRCIGHTSLYNFPVTRRSVARYQIPRAVSYFLAWLMPPCQQAWRKVLTQATSLDMDAEAMVRYLAMAVEG